MTNGTPAVLVALGAEADPAPVLETASKVADLMGGRVEVVADAGVSDDALLAKLDAPGVLGIVIGAGTTRRGEHPVGGTTRHVLERARKPVVVVPTGIPAARPLRRLLLPLEGSEETSRPVLHTLCPLLAGEVELVVLHVFTQGTLPRMLDRPVRDLEMLGREFVHRHFPPASRIHLEHGTVSARVAELCAAGGIDMVVLSWSQDSSQGRARVVREVLAAVLLPVLLLPVAGRGDQGL